MALLEIRNVSRRFGAFEAVKNVSFAVESGEFFTLLGPSGCGKTTLLRMIAGFDLPDAGQIFLDGRDLADTPAERRPIHTVFQSYALFPHLTVAGNVAFPLRMAGKSPAEIDQRVAEALAQVHLSELAKHYPHEISGGQKQRVALARGLINRPRLLLLDEPLGALDLKLREAMQVELIRLQREVGITFVFVTHAQPEALALSDRIAVMRGGIIEQLDEPSKLYGFPANRFVADFIGNCNLLDAAVAGTEGDCLRLTVAGLGEIRAPAGGVADFIGNCNLLDAAVAGTEGDCLRLTVAGLGEIRAPAGGVAQPGDQGVLALRPEQVRIVGDGLALDNVFPGTVKDFLYIGDVTTYQVALDNGFVLETLLPNSTPGRARFHEVGDRVTVGWPKEAGHYVRN